MADQKINALPTKTAPVTGDKCLMSGAAEEYLIDYDKLATAILNKLTSKTFTLDQGTKTLIAAINELNSKSQILYDYTLIPENADMDSYRSYGTYGCSSNNVAITLKNDPFQTAFKLSVENSTGVNNKYVCQIYRRLYDGAIAYRYLNDSNEWSNYYYITPNK